MKRAAPSAGPALSEDLCQCPVCLEGMFGKIVLCPEGHGICADPCHQGLPAPKVCPQCRIAYSRTPPRGIMVEQIIASCQWPCKHGCGSMLQGADMANHFLTCSARPAKCPKCDSMLKLAEFGQHFEENKGDNKHIFVVAKQMDGSQLTGPQLQRHLCDWGQDCCGNKDMLLQRFECARPWQFASTLKMDVLGNRPQITRMLLADSHEMLVIRSKASPCKEYVVVRIFHCDSARRCRLRIGGLLLDGQSSQCPRSETDQQTDGGNEIVFSFQTGLQLANNGKLAMLVEVFPSAHPSSASLHLAGIAGG